MERSGQIKEEMDKYRIEMMAELGKKEKVRKDEIVKNMEEMLKNKFSITGSKLSSKEESSMEQLIEKYSNIIKDKFKPSN